MRCDVTMDRFRIWSTFDNGNLAEVKKSDDDVYVLRMAYDLEGRNVDLIKHKNIRNWFHFKVKNFAFEAREIKFRIENIELK